MLVLLVIYGVAPKIQEEKRPLLYIGAGMTFILIVINIAIGIYITDKYCKKNEIEASKNLKKGHPKSYQKSKSSSVHGKTKFRNQSQKWLFQEFRV